MSRTLRKDKSDKVYPEGQTNGVWFRCSCSYCNGEEKRHLEKQELAKDLKRELDDWYDPEADWGLIDDYWDNAA